MRAVQKYEISITLAGMLRMLTQKSINIQQGDSKTPAQPSKTKVAFFSLQQAWRRVKSMAEATVNSNRVWRTRALS
eukprot:190585-Prorocentrum_minimum.AAC.1